MRILTQLFLCLLIVACSSSKTTAEKDAEPAPAQVEAKEQPTPPAIPEKPASLTEGTYWEPYAEEDLPDLEKRLEPTKFELWMCHISKWRGGLEGESPMVFLPSNNGVERFQLTNSGTMNSELAEQFPNLRSFKGASVDGTTTARVDTNDDGIFAEYKSNGEIYLLAPYLKGSDVYYVVYNKKNLPTTPRENFEKE